MLIFNLTKPRNIQLKSPFQMEALLMQLVGKLLLWISQLVFPKVLLKHQSLPRWKNSKSVWCNFLQVNGELWDLTRVLESDCTVELIKFDADDGKTVFWHSSSHMLGQAMEYLYNCSLTTGPPIQEGGFYYDAEMKR
jgi:hypothetical protein